MGQQQINRKKCHNGDRLKKAMVPGPGASPGPGPLGLNATLGQAQAQVALGLARAPGFHRGAGQGPMSGPGPNMGLAHIWPMRVAYCFLLAGT